MAITTIIKIKAVNEIKRKIKGSKGRYARLIITGIFSFLCILVAQAATDHYDYDPLGRLGRHVGPDGAATEYKYDPVGNILQVITGATASPPVISSISPSSIRREETKVITISGSGLESVNVSFTGTGLSISNLEVSNTQVTFDLSSAASTALGSQQLTLSNASGSVSSSLTINPVLPKGEISPLPVAIPPDSVARQISLRFSSADNISHTFAVTSANPNLVTISPATLTIPAGEISAQLTIKGLAAGVTSINLVSSTIGSISAPVYITSEFAGINTNYSPLVGVKKEPGPGSELTLNVNPLASPIVGIAKGGFINGISPNALAIGSGPTLVTVTGEMLQNTTVTVTPDDGLTLGQVNIAQDGKSLTVPITVANDASVTQRQVIVSAAGANYLPINPLNDRLNITLPMPSVTSVEPLFATPGTDALKFVVRGQRLQGGTVVITPSNGIVIGTSPVINSEGTELVTTISISAVTSPGKRLVQIRTLSGDSEAVQSEFNSFTVVSEISENYSPINAPLVGVKKEVESTSTINNIYSASVGLAVGSVVSKVVPQAGSIGKTVPVTLYGSELQNVTAILLEPSVGLITDAPNIAADGKSLTFNLSIAEDALLSSRTMKVVAGNVLVPFSNSFNGIFDIVAPWPRIDSVDPIIIPVPSSTLRFSVRGENLGGAMQLQIQPSTGVNLTSPIVNAEGTEATVSLSVSADAVLGQRSLLIVTPAGQSSSEATIANTVTFTNKQQETYEGITAPIVGVSKSGNQESSQIGPITAPSVGVTLTIEPEPPTSPSYTIDSSTVGVITGSVGNSVQPLGVAAGTNSILKIKGQFLDQVTAITFKPSSGISVGNFEINADGTEAAVAVELDFGAQAGYREIVLNSATGVIPFASPDSNRLWIAAGIPTLDSLSPILGTQGSSLDLTIRGNNFLGASEVTVEPANGVQIVSSPVVNSTGTEITVSVKVLEDAALGSRVIRVAVPGLISTDQPSPSNTFTVYQP